LIADRAVERRTADLTGTADRDVVLGNGKHASCQCIPQGH
jgi:hypothetical protein